MLRMPLQSPKVRVVLAAMPAVVLIAAGAAALESAWAIEFTVNVLAGGVLASCMFVLISIVARQAADERVLLAQSNRTPRWRDRANQTLGFKHKDSDLYADWYFRLRLQEEIDRCQRYGTRVTVLLAKGEGDWTANALRAKLRRSDLPALLRDGALGVILPNTARHAAMQARLTKTLASSARLGLACYPEDGEDASALLRAADLAADSSAPAQRAA